MELGKKTRLLAALIFRFETRGRGSYVPFDKQPRQAQEPYLKLAKFLLKLHNRDAR